MAISRAQTPKNVANPSLYSKAKAKAKTNNMGLYSRY